MEPGLVLIVVGGIVLYVASAAGADALRGYAIHSAGWMAIGHWIPIAMVAVGAMLLNRPEVALGVIFATSVASVSLVIGAVVCLSPLAVPDRAKMIWPTLLPAAMLAFLAGFRGELTYLHGITLAMEGCVVLWVWREPSTTERQAASHPRVRYAGLRMIQLVLAIVLAGIGAWFGVRGVVRVGTVSEITTPGLLSATLLSPLLVLPMLGAGIELAHQGKAAAAVTSQIAVGLLNLCVLLPVVIAIGYFRYFLFGHLSANWLIYLQMFFHADSAPSARVQFPLAVWRVDVVALIALSLFLLPVAQRRWALSKGNGIALICGYAAYLMLATALGVRTG